MNEMQWETPSEASTPFKEFRDSGLLWLINTTTFHPRGYAIGFVWENGASPETDEPTGWNLYGDGTEPWVFDPAGAPPHRTLDALFAAANNLMPQGKP